MILEYFLLGLLIIFLPGVVLFILWIYLDIINYFFEDQIYGIKHWFIELLSKIKKRMKIKQVIKSHNLMPYYSEIMLLRNKELQLKLARESLVKKILQETEYQAEHFIKDIVFSEASLENFLESDLYHSILKQR